MCYFFRFSSISRDADQIGADPDPTFKKNPDTYPSLEKKKAFGSDLKKKCLLIRIRETTGSRSGRKKTNKKKQDPIQPFDIKANVGSILSGKIKAW